MVIRRMNMPPCRNSRPLFSLSFSLYTRISLLYPPHSFFFFFFFSPGHIPHFSNHRLVLSSR